jgi:hypothetical protein
MARNVRLAYACAVVSVLLIAAPALAQEQEEVAAPVGVTGEWIMTVESDQGAMDMNLTLKQEEKEVTGTLESEMGILELAGEIGEENDITFWASIEAPDGSGYYDLFFSGTIVENKTITGMLDLAGMMTADFVAKRKEKK